MPAITLLLLATCCNLTFTKRKMKSPTDRLMQAVSENEPVIQAAIARGFDQHEVHVCVRHFYTKNPSFVPLSEARLLQFRLGGDAFAARLVRALAQRARQNWMYALILPACRVPLK